MPRDVRDRQYEQFIAKMFALLGAVVLTSIVVSVWKIVHTLMIY